MRITDILEKFSQPGAIVIDATLPENDISPYLTLPPSFNVKILRFEDVSATIPTGGTIVVREGPSTPPALATALSEVGEEVVQLNLYHSVEALFQSNLAVCAAESGWEIASLHRTNHSAFPTASALRKARDTDISSLRILNEFRVMRFAWRSREDELDELRPRAAAAEMNRQHAMRSMQHAEEIKNRDRVLKEENEYLRERYARVSSELETLQSNYEALIQTSSQHEKRAEKLSTQLNRSYQRLQKSRNSMSFRIGRATKLSIREAGQNKLAMPGKWLEAFRGPDEVLEDADKSRKVRLPPLKIAKAKVEAKDHRDAERTHYLLGAPGLRGDGPFIAGIASAEMARQMSASARFHELLPNSWQYQLEGKTPSYLLVCSDGLEANTAWGSYGVPDGRGASDLVRQLADFCRERQIPIAYWDTKGAPVARLAAPRGVVFDAVYTISKTLTGTIIGPGNPPTELLLAAVASRLFNPIGARRENSHKVIFDGPFDRRVSRSELDARTAILKASRDKELVILDSSSRICGASWQAWQFPEEFAADIQERPPIETRARAYKDARVVASGQSVVNADFVSWNLLAALASGSNVMSTPLGDVDPVLKATIATAATIEEASAALDTILGAEPMSDDWTRMASYLSEHYDLGARLNKIAEDLRRGGISPMPPEIGLFARVDSIEEIETLRVTLAGLTPQPAEVHVMTDLHDQVRSSLANLGASLFVYDPSTDSSRIPAATSTASHLICWESTSCTPANMVSIFKYAASISQADILAIEDRSAPSQPIFRYDRTSAPMVQALTSPLIGRTVGEAPSSVCSSLDALLLQGDVQQLVIALPPVVAQK